MSPKEVVLPKHQQIDTELPRMVRYIISMDLTPPTYSPGQPPADDYQETIAGLEEQNEQLMADLNAANEEISSKPLPS